MNYSDFKARRPAVKLKSSFVWGMVLLGYHSNEGTWSP